MLTASRRTNYPIRFAGQALPTREVYLAGPVSGLTSNEARFDWRYNFALIMPDHIMCRSPMRTFGCYADTMHLKDELPLSEIEELRVGKNIFAKDEHDIRSSDLMVACFLGAKKISKGSLVELGMAYTLNKPIVLVIEPSGNVHDHSFVDQVATHRVDNLADAADRVAYQLTPGL